MTARILTLPRRLPGHTRVVDAVRQAQAAGAGLWMTDDGQVLIAPRGLPGWRRLPIRQRRVAA